MKERSTIPAAIHEPYEALRALAPFQLFSDEELREIVPLCEIKSFSPETTIIREGDPSDNRVFFLLAGGVSIYVADNFILALKRAGDIFGEMSLINDEPRSATVTADQAATMLVVNSALTFKTGEANYYKFRYYFSRMFNGILTSKLRMTSERAKMYEVAVKQSLEVRKRSTSLQEEIQHNINQIRVYSHLVESATDAILILNTSGLILEENASMERIFGHEAIQIVGTPIAELLRLPATGGGSWESLAADAATTGWNGEVEVASPEGEIIPADCSISLVQDRESEALAYSVILRDMRERKAYEAQILSQSSELKQANEELQTLDRLKDNFITLVSHELRTPLSSIMAYSEALNMEGMVEPEEQGEFLAIIHREAQKLGEMVNKVLSISKMESGQMLFEFKESRLDEIVEFMAASAKEEAQSKNLDVNVDIKKEFKPTCFDSGKIQEVLRQILDNAIKFTDSGSIDIRVCQYSDNSLIEIKDTGKGIDEGHITEVFDKFNWVDNIQHHQNGIGLGLPLSFLIVNAHSGRMELKSKKGAGTTVSVWLPHRPEAA